ncbi:hypothetical protein DICVIV_00882 [Dictyocaulus viviparus]|uniref:Nucleotide-diphospho-sugar transferase domain-containing protein n=1 Tax=Dictyocaulus viviparus TaxID=29172 RepID=A0A0D8Y8E6_DICVI|nr:hypothetical protein DICVIV_00882 [Dictyocaulus viviparus]
MHDYPLKLVTINDYNQCRQRDLMFRRHCIVSMILETTDWVLFIDADIGIVNPTRLIEEYVDTRYDITFYDRFCSWEIAMGSYIVKSTPFSRDFLMKFAYFESRLPDSFHGSDNGAIHAYILETLASESRRDAQVCYSIWEQSTSYDDLFLFEACLRTILGSRRIFDKVRILSKGTGWVRDIWITRSQWSFDRDFMLHGMKEADRSLLPDSFSSKFIIGILSEYFRSMFKSRFTWYPPIIKKLDMKKCSVGDVEWQYDMRLQVPRSTVEEQLHELSRQVEKKRWRLLARIKNHL